MLLMFCVFLCIIVMKGDKNMLIYEYPPKLNRAERQAKAIHDLQEHKKMRRNMYKNLILGAVIIAVSFFADFALVKAVLILIGAANMAVALLIYMYYALSRDADVYTRIYDNHIEHSQRISFSKKYLHISLFYDEVEKSYQTKKGRLVCELKNISKSEFFVTDKEGGKSAYTPDGKAVLDFQDTNSKLKLINECWEKINYPHKDYKEFDETDDGYYSEEDLKWDRLHKHGL